MPLSWIYGKIADLRNTLYDKGVLRSRSLGARVISIGNITAGGTGKTPLVAFVAGILAARGETVCVLTRGYGRTNPNRRVLVSDGSEILANAWDAGDEPLELAGKLLGKAVVIADADRASAARWAKAAFGITAFVLDDAFQHRKVQRDLDIVCVDATSPFGGRKMLPSGRLREPLHNLKRADVVVITRANLMKDIDDLKSEISGLNPDCSIFAAENKIVRMVSLEEFHAKTQRPQNEESTLVKKVGEDTFASKGNRAFAFCGIGNPENFFEQLRQENFEVAATEAFRDHRIYTQQDVANIEEKALEYKAEILLTTAKDAVKLNALAFTTPCFVVEIELIIDRAEDFAAMI